MDGCSANPDLNVFFGEDYEGHVGHQRVALVSFGLACPGF